jgi:hypothetical protein
MISKCPAPGALRRRIAEIERSGEKRTTRPADHAGEFTDAEVRVLRLLDAGLSEHDAFLAKHAGRRSRNRDVLVLAVETTQSTGRRSR